MKRIYFIIIAFVCQSILGQNTLLFENFNDGFPAGWQLIDNDGLTPYDDAAVNFITEAWVLHEDYDSLGINDNILVSTSWFIEDGNADDYLILPSINLGSFGNYISFDVKSKDQTYPDGFEILFTTTDLSPWTFTHNEIIFHDEDAPSYWTNMKISLDSVGITNQNVIIAFRHFGNNKYILELDNIKIVTNDPLSINDSFNERISIFPNPSNGIFSIKGLAEMTDYCITDLNGIIVAKGKTTNSLKLDLPQGMYFLKIENETIQKLIIE